eukprot:scpid108953/ scgid12116/ 
MQGNHVKNMGPSVQDRVSGFVYWHLDFYTDEDFYVVRLGHTLKYIVYVSCTYVSAVVTKFGNRTSENCRTWNGKIPVHIFTYVFYVDENRAFFLRYVKPKNLS